MVAVHQSHLSRSESKNRTSSIKIMQQQHVMLYIRWFPLKTYFWVLFLMLNNGLESFSYQRIFLHLRPFQGHLTNAIPDPRQATLRGKCHLHNKEDAEFK